MSGYIEDIFFIYDDFYRSRHQLKPTGSLIYMGAEVYSERSARFFADNTVLRYGDPVGVLHFNNRYLLNMRKQAENKGRIGWLFREELFASLRELAKLSLTKEYNSVDVFTGVTWLPTHGEKVGFLCEELPDSIKNLFLVMHFKIMLYVFYGRFYAGNRRQRLKPQRFWLTKNQLLANFYPGL